jgi:hypothetical protein
MRAQRGFFLSLWGAALLALNPACADQRLTKVTGVCSSLSVTVSAGISPTFSWDAACPIQELIVALPGPGAVVWSAVSVNLTNSIASPVTYASTPPGAAMTANVVQFLVAGTTYDVTLLRAADTPGGPLQLAGSATFVP